MTVSVLDVKPPLDLHAEVVTADGTRFRWGSSVPDPKDVVQQVQFASKRYEGFERSSCSLARPIDRDYPDLGLFDSLNFIGYDGTVAHEARIAQIPRSTPHGIDVEATGWMAHARDRRFVEVYVDPEPSGWQAPSLARRVQHGANPMDMDYHAESGAGYLQFEGATDKQILLNSTGELHYRCPPGVAIAKIAYKGTEANLTSVEAALLYTADTDSMTGPATAALTLDDTLRTAAVTTPQRYAMLRATASATHNPGTNQFRRRYSKMAVYANHGLTARTVASGEPDGFYVSDMIRDICSRFCPRLDPSGVEGTTWPVGLAKWVERAHPYDAWLELNKYHLWELAVWDNRTLHYYPADFTDYDWQVKTTDPGVSVSLQGPATDQLANYAVVNFRNFRTGQDDEVSPDTHGELRDENVENPANRHGLDVELEVKLSQPNDPDGAAQIGRALLAEHNAPKDIGTITVKGHIRDRAGHWQPGWKVRAGETIAITNFPNSRPRMIGEPAWDHSTKTATIAVDSTLKRVDAFLDRFGTALRAGGVEA